jgi:hypothetical protein
VASTSRGTRRVRRLTAAVIAAFAAALLAALLAGCGGSTASTDPLVGYWVGGGTGAQMTLVQISSNGGKYAVLANPNRPTGSANKEGDSLLVDTHAVLMRFTPVPADKLQLQFTGQMFKKPVTQSLSRTDQTGYADAATAYGIVAIRRGLAMWKAGGGKKYPPAKEVASTGMLAKMIRWPVNLFTGQPMKPGGAKGDYTYSQVGGGKSYSLLGHLSDGSTIGK